MAKDTESIVVPTQAQDTVEETKQPGVLSRYRIEGKDGDAVIYERIILNEQYSDRKGVKKFVTSNGKVTYYAEKQVKKYSDNVVEA